MVNESYPYDHALKIKWGKEVLEYEISIEFLLQKVGEDLEQHILKYDAQMQVIGYIDSVPNIRLEKKNLILNNKRPETIIDDITLDTSEVVNNLEFSIDQYGRIAAIHNFETITNRWTWIRQAISERFPGEAIEFFLNMMQKSLETPESLLKSFERDPLLSTFFNGIYSYYDHTPKHGIFTTGTLLPGFNLKYLTEKKWVDMPDDFVQITEKGRLDNNTVEKEKLLLGLNARTNLERSNYNKIDGTMEIKTLVSLPSGVINNQSSTFSIIVDDIKLENKLLVIEK
jgi:hypothetical protein